MQEEIIVETPFPSLSSERKTCEMVVMKEGEAVRKVTKEHGDVQ